MAPLPDSHSSICKKRKCTSGSYFGVCGSCTKCLRSTERMVYPTFHEQLSKIWWEGSLDPLNGLSLKMMDERWSITPHSSPGERIIGTLQSNWYERLSVRQCVVLCDAGTSEVIVYKLQYPLKMKLRWGGVDFLISIGWGGRRVMKEGVLIYWILEFYPRL